MNTTISLEGMEFYAHHGCFEEERMIGGRFLVDVSIDADAAHAAKSDDIAQTIDYSAVYQYVKQEMMQPSNLIENAAYRIGQRILAEFAQAQSVMVKVAKLNPPLDRQAAKSSAAIFIENKNFNTK